MFGKLTLEQRKALQNFLIHSGRVDRPISRTLFLEDAGLGSLLPSLPLDETTAIFSGALVRECERLGAPPSLQGRFATVLLAEALLEILEGQPEAVKWLDTIIGVYDPNAVKPISPSTPQSKELRILFLAANPIQWGKLSLTEEFERVTQMLRESEALDSTIKVNLQLVENVKDEEIIKVIQRFQPHILHFAGHGDLERVAYTPSTPPALGKWRGLYIVDENNHILDIKDNAKPSGIILETATGKGKLLPSKVLQTIFADPIAARSIRLVFLNACWAQGQAELLVEKAGVPFAIGMNQPVNDKAAVRFAEGFYQTLFNKQYSLQSAFDSAKNQMVAVLGHGHEDVPTLKVRGGLSAGNYHIFETL